MSELLQSGQLFAERYRVERFIAQGGFGAVYAAEQTETELRVALKVLWPHILQSGDAVEQFKLEARVAGRVASEHIVRVFDAGLDAATGMPFLVMELLDGKDMEHVVKSLGPRPPELVVQYFRQIASALDRAHGYVDRSGTQKPIVHRDLKPENLFLTHRETGEPVVKILDFGIAKVLSQSTQVSQTVKGTPLYMAFEQAAAGRITPQTDIWALGLIAFYLLTGRCYWKTANLPEASLTQLFGEVLALPIEPPSQRARDIGASVTLSGGFDAWFARCVDRDPAMRFATAGECAAGLALVFDDPQTRPSPGTFQAIAFNATALAQPPESPALGPSLTAGDRETSASGAAVPTVASPDRDDARVSRAAAPRLTTPALVVTTAVALAAGLGVFFTHHGENPKPAAHESQEAHQPLSSAASAIASAPNPSASSQDPSTTPVATVVAPKLDVRMPDRIREGDLLDIAVSGDRELRVAIVYVEETGEGALLLPSPGVRDPVVSPGHDLRLPPLRPTLRHHGTAASERLVAYGFADAVDFQRVKRTPFRGSAVKYIADLDAALASVAPDRWVRREISYVIEPR